MDATRRVPFRVLAVVLAVGVLTFVVSRAWRQQEAARAEPPIASPTASPTASSGAASPTEASSKSRYGVIGPATKNDPHVIQRAIESLSSDPPNEAPRAPSPAPPAEKP